MATYDAPRTATAADTDDVPTTGHTHNDNPRDSKQDTASTTGGDTPQAFDPAYVPKDPCRVNPEGVDPEMRRWKWVNWALDEPKGKVPKRPKTPHRNAKSNDASTWGDYDDALAVAIEHRDRGMGFPLVQVGQPFTALDIDIPEGGDWLPPLDRLDGATVEYSPSGNLRVYLRGVDVPTWWKNQSEHITREGVDHTRELAVMTDAGYVTVTGDILPGFDAEVDTTPQSAFETFLKDVWWAFNPDATNDDAPWHDAAQNTTTSTNRRCGLGRVDLTVTDVVPAGTPVGQRTAHPIHGSETGTNFMVDDDGETFRCWSAGHKATGNAMHFLGVEAGVFDCGEWADRNITATEWRETFDYAREQGYDVPEPPGQAHPSANAETSTSSMSGDESEAQSWVRAYQNYVKYAEEKGTFSYKQKRAKAAELLTEHRKYMARKPASGAPEKVPLWRYDSTTGVYTKDAVGEIHAELTDLAEELNFGNEDRKGVVRNVRNFSFTKSETFDAGAYDETLLAVENGVINVDAGEFHGDHDPEYRLRTRLPVTYDPDADCPNIDAFLDAVTDGNATAKQTLYEWAGYCLLDGYPIHAFLLLHGDGGNGKGVYLDLLDTFLGGDENVSNVGLSKMTADDRFALAQLDGKLANIDRDIPGRSISTEQLAALKKLSAGEPKQVEHKNEAPFTLRNRAKLVFAANDPPRFWEASESVARRLLAIEFPRQFKGTAAEKTEAELEAELMNDDELSGLLNKALVALQDVLNRNGFAIQEGGTARERFDAYMENADSIVAYASKNVEERPGHLVTKDAFYDAYTDWCRANGYEPTDRSVFFREFGKKTAVSYEGKRNRVNGDPTRLLYGIWFTTEGEQHISEEHAGHIVEAMDAKRSENANAAYKLQERVRDRLRVRNRDGDDASETAMTDDEADVEQDTPPTTIDSIPTESSERTHVPKDAKGVEADKQRILNYLDECEALGNPTPSEGHVCGVMARKHDLHPDRVTEVLNSLLADRRVCERTDGYVIL